jgi:hypothetical protein
MPVYYYRFKICRTVTLPVVLYGCETWSLTLREKHRLRVFENTVLRKIHGSKRDEVTGEWRRQHNEELNDLYCPPNDLYCSPNVNREIKLRIMRRAGQVACMRRGDVHTGFWCGKLREGNHLEDLVVDGRIILK